MTTASVISVEEFAANARAWLADNRRLAPPDYGAIMPPGLKDRGQAWQAALHAAGLAGIHWPKEVGGQGLTVQHNAAWQEICAVEGVPSVLNMVGLVLTAGAILTFGTPEQQAEHLPRTAKGEVVWCQLFSEPGAGSDLASLSTRAERDGDEYVVNGQKVWTSGARCSEWGILLARTDPAAPKHKGISFFLLDMRSPGVETRPLKQMNGEAEFDEVFFTDVRVPAGNLIGELGQGWGVAMGALTNERGFIGGSTISLGRRMDALAAAGFPDEPVERDALAGMLAQGRALQYLGKRQGPVASTANSLLKLAIGDLHGELANARLNHLGAGGMLDGSEAFGVVSSPGAKLGGGTSEIQRTIIGERLLGLPAEPKPAKG